MEHLCLHERKIESANIITVMVTVGDYFTYLVFVLQSMTAVLLHVFIRVYTRVHVQTDRQIY